MQCSETCGRSGTGEQCKCKKEKNVLESVKTFTWVEEGAWVGVLRDENKWDSVAKDTRPCLPW